MHNHQQGPRSTDRLDASLDAARAGLVRAVRDQIDDGTYDSDHRLDIAVTRMIERVIEEIGDQPQPNHKRAA